MSAEPSCLEFHNAAGSWAPPGHAQASPYPWAAPLLPFCPDLGGRGMLASACPVNWREPWGGTQRPRWPDVLPTRPSPPAQDPLEVPDSVGSTLRFGLWLGLLLAMCSLPAAQMNE